MAQQSDVDPNAAPMRRQADESLEQRMNEIKAHLIATIIMEKTRSLKPKQKKKVKAFCDKVLFDEMFDEADGELRARKENIISRLQQYHYTNMNPLRIRSVRKLDIQDQAKQLMQMYHQAVKKIDWLLPEDESELERRKYIFHTRYDDMIKQVEENHEQRKFQKLEQKNRTGQDKYKGDGFTADQLGNDDDMQILRNLDDEGSKLGQVGGIFDPNENISVQQFFHNLTKIFKNINFYNLLDITHEQANKDSELIGNDDQ